MASPGSQNKALKMSVLGVWPFPTIISNTTAGTRHSRAFDEILVNFPKLSMSKLNSTLPNPPGPPATSLFPKVPGVNLGCRCDPASRCNKTAKSPGFEICYTQVETTLPLTNLRQATLSTCKTEIIAAFLAEWWWGLNTVRYVKCLAQGGARSRRSKDGACYYCCCHWHRGCLYPLGF